jgi:ribose transport system substrate-binding protein
MVRVNALLTRKGDERVQKPSAGNRLRNPFTTMRGTLAVLAGMAALAGLGLAAAGIAAAATRSTAAAGGCNLNYVKKQIASYGGVPRFTPPGAPLDVSKLRGKFIYDIPLNSGIQFVNIIDQSMKKIAESLGLKFAIATNQGQTSQFVQGMNQAISQKADAIILSQAPDPKLLQPQIVAAKKAGIPTISTHWYDIHDATDTPSNVKPPNLAADVPAGFTTITRLEADWATLKSNCKAHVIGIYASDSDGHKQMINAMVDEFARYCGSGCKVYKLGLPFIEWPTKMQSNVQTLINGHPDVNWVLPDVDYGVQFAVPAINGTGKVGKIKIATFNGTPSVLKQVRDGNIVDMDIGENLEWLAYADLDQTFRVMLGMKPVPEEHTALRIFSKENVRQTGNPPAFNKGFGTNAFVAGYRNLWGLK